MMTKITQEIEELIRKADVTGAIELTTPPKPEMGDVAFPVFGIAKAEKKNPVEVAKEITEKLKAISYKPASPAGGLKAIERVEAFGPYVNFFLSTPQISQMVISEIAQMKERYGSNTLGKGKKVMIEYPSNNTHKEFHIGHLRNVSVGNPLVQLYEKSGYKVYPVNYLNDFGAHVARCLWGILKFHQDEKPPENTQKWLGEIYAEASGYLKEHPEAEGEVAEVLQKLEAEDKSIWPLFMRTRKWSVEKFDELFQELGVKHVAEFYEKDVKKKGQKIVDELLKKKVATVGERGAIIIDLKQYNLDTALVRKADGAGLYITSDLSLAEEKFKQFDVDESIYITGQEQVFYFKQLFKVLELIGFKKKLTHLSYGLVNLPEGKMSSRTGNVILYEDLHDQVFEQRHQDWKEKKVTDTAFTLTLAALKFDMMKHEAVKNITFDIKEATSFEGFSAPYVLYVVARINSLVRKSHSPLEGGSRGGVRSVSVATRKLPHTLLPPSRGDLAKFELLKQPEEKKLAMLMGDYGEVVKKALETYNPSVIARYAFDLAQAFNEFYNKHTILNAEDPELVQARLALSVAVKQVLENALGVMTIEGVEEM